MKENRAEPLDDVGGGASPVIRFLLGTLVPKALNTNPEPSYKAKGNRFCRDFAKR